MSLEVNYRPTRFSSLRADEWTPAPPGPTLRLEEPVVDGRRVAGRLLTGGAASVVADWGDDTPRETLAAPWAFDHTYALDAVYELRAIATSPEGRTSVEAIRVQAYGDPTGGPDPGPEPHAYRDLVLTTGPVAYYRLGEGSEFEPDECGGPPGAYLGTTSRAGNILGGGLTGASTMFPDGELRVEGHPGVAAIAEEFSIEWLMFYDGGLYRTPVQSDNLWFGVSIAHPGGLYVLDRGSGTGLDLSAPIPSVARLHAAWTNDHGEQRFYLNGEVAGALPVAEAEEGEGEGEAEALPPTLFTVGRAVAGDNPFAYPLQEFALYDRALSVAEVRAHFTASGIPPEADPEPPPTETRRAR